MPGLWLLVTLPSSPKRFTLLVSRQAAHPVTDQDAVHRRACDAQTVKAPQIGGDPARPKVVSLPKVKNLCNDFPGRRSGERCGTLGRSSNPASPWTLCLAFHL